MKLFIHVNIILTLAFSVCLASTGPECTALIQTKAPSETISSDRGIVLHIEHFADLILSQAGENNDREIRAFGQTAAILAGHSESPSELNEKFDGSPSVVAGFDPDGTPWVTYKGKFEAKKQVVFRNAKDVDEAYGQNEDLRSVFKQLIQHLLPHLQKMGPGFHNYIFQGDVLFVGGDQKRTITESEIILEPNSLTYVIPSENPLFSKLRQASVGLVLHTVAVRKVEQSGRLIAEPAAIPEALKALVERNNDAQLFLLHPFRDAPRTLEVATW